MYEGTSTEQKAKNAKSGLDSMSKPLLQSPPSAQCAATSIYTKEAKFGFLFIRHVSAHFIDSLGRLIIVPTVV